MWAIRKASVRMKSHPFPPVTFRAFYAKSETSRSSYTDDTGFKKLSPHIPDRSLTLKRLYSQAHGCQSYFIKKPSFSRKDATGNVVQGTNVEHDETDGELISESNPFEYEDDDDDDIDVGIPQNEGDSSDIVENNCQGRKSSSGLFNAIIDSSSISVKEALDKWLEEGNDLSRTEISLAMSEFRKRRMYWRAFKLSVWLEAQEKVELGERDYASCVDLVAKSNGLQNAEIYIEESIPESFKTEVVYQALLANCVLNINTKKSEQIFNKIKNLKLPITTFACDQMLLLYKKTDRKKIIDLLLLMEKENIKPSLLTYRLLIDVKGESRDLSGIEQLLEKMKGDGLKPDLKLQSLLARHYVNLGVIEKAKSVLKEMEGGNLKENRLVCSSLFPIYALLESPNDVKRVWKVCESDPKVHECLSAIDAFGKLKKVKEAELVFDKMSLKWKQPWAKHYTAMLKVYTYNKMFTEAKSLLKRMYESGCGIGPQSLDAIVEFYLKANEIEEADLILNTSGSMVVKGKPLFVTYMKVLDEYGKRGDVCNAEKIIEKMREDGYVLKRKQYDSLLQAYINAKIPAYGFRKRLEADGILISKFMEARLARVDVFKETSVSYLID